MNDAQTPPTPEELRAVIEKAEAMGKHAMADGDFKTAQTIYEHLIDIDPKNAHALNHLAVIAIDEQRFDVADSYLRRATQAAPDWAEPHASLAILYLGQGRGRRAAKAVEKALALDADNAGYRYILANAYKAMNDAERYERTLKNVIDQDSYHAAANNDLGCLAAQRGQLEDAVGYLERALADPEAPGSYMANLGKIRLIQNRPADAEELLKRAIANDGADLEAHIALAVARRTLGNLQEALKDVESLIGQAPDHPGLLNVSGTVYRELGHFFEARNFFERALAVHPGDAAAQSNLALLRLLRGELKQGWIDYEARRRESGFQSLWGGSAIPDWRGENVAGKTVLVLAEQGLGDSIQFARFLPKLADMGATVKLAVQPELTGLMATLDPRIDLIQHGEDLGKIDYQVLLLSLPRYLGIDSYDDVDGKPYLSVPKASDDALAAALGALSGYKVGINWRGSPNHKEDFKRSLSPALFDAIGDVDGVTLVRLDFGDTDPSADVPEGTVDLSEHVASFADTARVLDALDLIVSVDTATVHLAGALGKPCWALIPFVPDWRWRREGDTTPWYDSVRLFRQPALGDWTSVFEAVGAALAEEIS